MSARLITSPRIAQQPAKETVAQIKPAVFPSPSPLTAEERAFMAALNQSLSTVPVAAEPDKAITIAEIEIKPLAIGGVSQGEQE